MAKLFLESTDTSYKVSSNNTTVFGATGDQAITIDAGLTAISLDANVERVQFTGATTDYKYVQAGTDLKVYNAAGALVTTVGLQDDATGTQLTFANGTVKAAIVATVGAAPTLSVGGTAVTAIGATATPVAVVPATIDVSVASAPTPVFSVSAPTTSVTEATGATASFTVSLNAAQPAATTVKVATGSVGSSAATLDYGLIALTPVTGGATLDADGTVHFPAGITTATITVPVVVDSIAETGEGVSLTLSSPNTGATVGTATATVLIADPATPIFSLAASATSAVEGTPVVGSVAAATSGTVTLTVTRSGNLTGTDSVDLTATPGTALASDYGIAATTGQTGIVLPKVTFAPTETTKTITFTPVADSIRESNETLKVGLTNATTGASISTTGASVDLTITDDDLNQLPVITIPTTTPSAFISDSTAVTGISFADADDNIGFEVTVTAQGASQVSFSDLKTGVTNVVTAKNSAGTALAEKQTANSIVLAGTRTDVNVVLSKLNYTTNSTSPTSEALTISVKDTAGGVTTKTLAINIGQSGALSTNVNLTGTVGDDLFWGTLAHFNTFTVVGTTSKTITGLAGTDKLALNDITAALNSPTTSNITGVEILDLTTFLSDTAHTAIFDASKFDTALTTVNFTTKGLTAAYDITDNLTATTANPGTVFNLNNPAGTLTISGFTGTSLTNAATVNLNGGVINIVSLAGITGNTSLTTLNINSNGTVANTITTVSTLNATTANISISGAQDLTITSALPSMGSTPGTISGATATGKLTLTANAGGSKIIGGLAGDSLLGGLGADSLTGGAGNDTLAGGAGIDTIIGGTGVDSLTGGDGNDTFVFAPGDTGMTSTTRDNISDLTKNDIVKIGAYGITGLTSGNVIGTSATSAINKEVYIDATNKLLIIETAVDGSTREEINIPSTAANAPFVYNNAGTASDLTDDYLTVGSSALSSTVSGGKLTLQGEAGGETTLALALGGATVNSSLVSGGYATVVDASNITTAASDSKGINMATSTLTGIASALTITATSLNDTVLGSAGADSLFGGSGNDVITGGAGADTIDGGAGSDTLSYSDVTLATSHSLTNLSGMAINLSASSVAAATVATAAGGTIVLGGGAGVAGDALAAGTVAYLATTAANSTTTMVRDTVSNVEAVVGSDLADYIVAGASGGTITGGAGADVITAGAGVDKIVYNLLTEGGDTVSAFLTGADKILLKESVFTMGSGVAWNSHALVTTDANTLNYAETSTSLSATPQDLNGTAANTGSLGGIVVTGAGTGTAGVNVYYTTEIGAATSSNSTLLVTLSGLNTANIAATDFTGF